MVGDGDVRLRYRDNWLSQVDESCEDGCSATDRDDITDFDDVPIPPFEVVTCQSWQSVEGPDKCLQTSDAAVQTEVK